MKIHVLLVSFLFLLSCTDKEKEAAEVKAKKIQQEKILRQKKEVADRAIYLRNLFVHDSIEETKIKKYVVKKISGTDYSGRETTVEFKSYKDHVNEVIQKAKLEMRDDKYIAERLKLISERWGGEICMTMIRNTKHSAQGYNFKYVVTDAEGKEIKRGDGDGKGFNLGRKQWFNSMSVEFFNRREFPLYVYVIDNYSNKRFKFKIMTVYK